MELVAFWEPSVIISNQRGNSKRLVSWGTLSSENKKGVTFFLKGRIQDNDHNKWPLSPLQVHSLDRGFVIRKNMWTISHFSWQTFRSSGAPNNVLANVFERGHSQETIGEV